MLVFSEKLCFYCWFILQVSHSQNMSVTGLNDKLPFCPTAESLLLDFKSYWISSSNEVSVFETLETLSGKSHSHYGPKFLLLSHTFNWAIF